MLKKCLFVLAGNEYEVKKILGITLPHKTSDVNIYYVYSENALRGQVNIDIVKIGSWKTRPDIMHIDAILNPLITKNRINEITEAEALTLIKGDSMKTHDLKTWQIYFNPLWNSIKSFEIRKNDRDFNVDDILKLHEFCYDDKIFTGRMITAKITFILSKIRLQPFPLDSDYVIIAIRELSRTETGGGEFER